MSGDLRIAQEIAAARAEGESWAVKCLNCGAALSGHFCSTCGQRIVPPNPTIREVAGEALSEFAGWDGKVAETAKLLVLKPGALTCEYLAGRRVRYIQPLRLYLTFSVLFFILAAATPTIGGGGFNISHKGTTGPGGKDPDVVVPIAGRKMSAMTPEERKQILTQVASAPPLLRPMMRRVANDPGGFQRGVFEAMPKGLFILLPVFACFLAIFFRKRHFTEHLYFALHLHAFAFLALCLNEAFKFTGSRMISFFAGVTVLIWIVVYAHLAFRRVYGQSHIITLLKEIGIAALYIAASIPTIVGVALWVARG
jgi:hypothetical protein